MRTLNRLSSPCTTLACALLSCVGASIALGDNRTYDGSGNNLAHPTWGAAGIDLLRRSPPAYSDTISAMARASSPNPRDISNTVIAQTSSRLNDRGLSDMAWQWGQFVDHDLDISKLGTEVASVATQPSDPTFHGTAMGFSRSVFDPATGTSGPREQMNAITSYLDASNVYGSSSATADLLRTHSGGRLIVQTAPTGDLLPLNFMHVDMGALPGVDPATVFAAGDGRANEQPGLTCMHTLFLREHNRLADLISQSHTDWTDEQVFQLARKIVGAEVQKITYSDWLPALLGPGAIGPYQGYDPTVDATIATEFSAAAFRIGHTMLNGTILRLDASGNSIPEGGLTLRDHFFAPSTIADGGGISPLLRGLIAQPAQEIDVHIVDDVREFLFGPFGPPGSVGFDLASLNIQRGRDHGLCDYNAMRSAFGLPSLTAFSQISSDPVVVSLLQSTYGSISAIDPWVGMLAEDHLPGGSAGPLLTAVLVDQFRRTRAGDRFWYQNDPDLAPYLPSISATSLATIIRANTDIGPIQANVFFIRPAVCRADFNGSASLNAQDIFDFLGAWFAGDSRADFNGVNGIEVQDIYAYLAAWFAGCP
jgi:peroxidase